MIKRAKVVAPKPAVATPKLSKSDPDYYKKIGQISAARRKMTSKDFSAMAKLSHNSESRPDGYHGGRKPKVADGTKVAQ